jgi:dehydrogenase/reductase SDR family protein 1
MVANKSGLIVNISSYGGYNYFFNVAYTVGKSGVDRMATDCAIELKSENVAMVSLWPGGVKTEYIQGHAVKDSNHDFITG